MDVPIRETFWQRVGPSRLAHALARALPPVVAGGAIRAAARAMMIAKPATYRQASDNLHHILPHKTSEAAHKRALYRLFYNTVKDYYLFFRNLERRDNLASLRPPVHMDHTVRLRIEEAALSGRGLFFVASHTSNFDLAGIGMTHYLPEPMQVLSIANPTSGYRYFNERRQTDKGFVTPITPASLRQAIERLRNGGIVMTSGDRPIPGGNQPVTFFGHAAHLPTGYVRIPLATNALVMTVAYHFDGTAYHVLGGPLMELDHTGVRAHDIRTNAQRILAELEPFIRRAPDQWRVFERVFDDPAEAECPS